MAQLNGERHVETLGILIRDGGAKGLQSLNMAELEDLAMNFPSSETAAYAIVQSEWQRRGGPQLVARRQAEQKAWEEEQRRRAQYAEQDEDFSGRRRTRDNSYQPIGSPPASSYRGVNDGKTCTETQLSGPNGGRVVRCQ